MITNPNRKASYPAQCAQAILLAELQRRLPQRRDKAKKVEGKTISRDTRKAGTLRPSSPQIQSHLKHNSINIQSLLF